MLRLLFCAGWLALSLVHSGAQEKAGLSQGGSQILSTLSPADEEKFLAARTKALAENPDFKAEGESLMSQAQLMRNRDVPVEEKQAYMAKVLAHQQKLREMMLKDDPTLKPIFDQLDETLAWWRARVEKKRQEATQAQQQNPGGGAGAEQAGR